MRGLCCFITFLSGCSPFQTQHTPSILQPKSKEEIEKAVWEIRNTLIITRNEITIHETPQGYRKVKRKKVSTEQKLNHGTTYFIDPKHIVTTFHVVDNITDKTDLHLVKDDLENKRKIKIKVKLLKVSSIHDLALLESEIESKDFLTLRQTPVDPAKEKFWLFGYPDKRFIIAPLNYAKHLFNENSILFNRKDQLGQLAGSSGGPITDDAGQIIGIHHAGNEKQTVAISVKALTEFLNGSNRNCQDLSDEQCIELEWSHLQKVVQQNTAGLSQQNGIFSQAQHNYRIFGGSYEKWLEKRLAFKKLVSAIEDLNAIEYEVIQTYNKWSAGGSKDNQDYQNFLDARKALYEVNQNLKEALIHLDQLN